MAVEITGSWVSQPNLCVYIDVHFFAAVYILDILLEYMISVDDFDNSEDNLDQLGGELETEAVQHIMLIF